MRGAKLCISHNPSAADVKSRGSRKGGQNRRAIQKVAQPVEVVRIDSLTNVQALLLQTLADVRNGTLDAAVGRTVGYLAVVAVRVAEAVEFEHRVTQAEDHILELEERMSGNRVDARVIV